MGRSSVRCHSGKLLYMEHLELNARKKNEPAHSRDLGSVEHRWSKIPTFADLAQLTVRRRSGPSLPPTKIGLPDMICPWCFHVFPCFSSCFIRFASNFEGAFSAALDVKILDLVRLWGSLLEHWSSQSARLSRWHPASQTALGEVRVRFGQHHSIHYIRLHKSIHNDTHGLGMD